MNLNINAIEACINILECMISKEIRHVIQSNDHLKVFMTHRTHGWLVTKEEVKEQSYWYFRDDTAVIDWPLCLDSQVI